VAFVEWLDPIFVGGHWTPALIEMAGGCHPLNPPTAHASGAEEAAAAGKSFAVPTQQLVDMDPDIIIVCPCGLDMKASALTAQFTTASVSAPDPKTRKVVVMAVTADSRKYFGRLGLTCLGGPCGFRRVVHYPYTTA
jgi:hypothetical protein